MRHGFTRPFLYRCDIEARRQLSRNQGTGDSGTMAVHLMPLSATLEQVGGKGLYRLLGDDALFGSMFTVNFTFIFLVAPSGRGPAAHDHEGPHCPRCQGVAWPASVPA